MVRNGDRCRDHDGTPRKPRRKRSSGFGTVVKHGDRYRASYSYNGMRPSKILPTKSAGHAWLAAEQTDLNRGTWIDPARGRMTLSSWSRRWLDGRTDLKPVTRAKYEHMLARHVLPALGTIELGKLSPSVVRPWYMKLRGQYQTTGDDAYRMLKACLNAAVSDGLVLRNPCQIRGAGATRSAERPVASIPEVIAGVETVPERWKLAILLASWCQLRRGEIVGLQRRDVDLDSHTIKIRRTVVRPMKGPIVVGPPKSEAGVRALTVPNNVIPALRHHLEHFVGPNRDDWLFTTERGVAVKPGRLDRIWERARETIGRPDVTLHDLRHSGLTWAAASGASIADLMRRGGHSTSAAAVRYQHSTRDRDRAIADALADLAAKAERDDSRQPEPIPSRRDSARRGA